MSGKDSIDNIFSGDGRYRFENTGRLATAPNSSDVTRFAKDKLAIPAKYLKDNIECEI